MALKQLPIVGVMGSSEHAHEDLAGPLGALLAGLPVHLLTGAGQGVMAAVGRSFVETKGRRGLSIGIVPAVSIDDPATTPEGYPNDFIELPIRTHLVRKQPLLWDGLTRNHINILTADAIVALPGSHGTLHEIAVSIRLGRPTALLLHRADEMGAQPPTVRICLALDDVAAFLSETLSI